jgi:hypothetical protein
MVFKKGNPGCCDCTGGPPLIRPDINCNCAYCIITNPWIGAFVSAENGDSIFQSRTSGFTDTRDEDLTINQSYGPIGFQNYIVRIVGAPRTDCTEWISFVNSTFWLDIMPDIREITGSRCMWTIRLGPQGLTWVAPAPFCCPPQDWLEFTYAGVYTGAAGLGDIDTSNDGFALGRTGSEKVEFRCKPAKCRVCDPTKTPTSIAVTIKGTINSTKTILTDCFGSAVDETFIIDATRDQFGRLMTDTTQLCSFERVLETGSCGDYTSYMWVDVHLNSVGNQTSAFRDFPTHPPLESGTVNMLTVEFTMAAVDLTGAKASQSGISAMIIQEDGWQYKECNEYNATVTLNNAFSGELLEDGSTFTSLIM